MSVAAARGDLIFNSVCNGDLTLFDPKNTEDSRIQDWCKRQGMDPVQAHKDIAFYLGYRLPDRIESACAGCGFWSLLGFMHAQIPRDRSLSHAHLELLWPVFARFCILGEGRCKAIPSFLSALRTSLRELKVPRQERAHWVRAVYTCFKRAYQAQEGAFAIPSSLAERLSQAMLLQLRELPGTRRVALVKALQEIKGRIRQRQFDEALNTLKAREMTGARASSTSNSTRTPEKQESGARPALVAQIEHLIHALVQCFLKVGFLVEVLVRVMLPPADRAPPETVEGASPESSEDQQEPAPAPQEQSVRIEPASTTRTRRQQDQHGAGEAAPVDLLQRLLREIRDRLPPSLHRVLLGPCSGVAPTMGGPGNDRQHGEIS